MTLRLLAVCAVLGARPAAAAPALPGPDAVKPEFYDVEFRVEAGKWDLEKENPGPSREGRDRAGYSSSHVEKKLKLHWDYGEEARGRTQLWLTRVEIDFTQTLTGAISSKYPKDSCVFNVVKAHELGHLKAFMRIFRAGEKELRSDLQLLSLPTAEAPEWVEDVEKAQGEIGGRVAQAIRDAAETLKFAMLLDRTKKDMPKEYEKDYAKCPVEEWGE